MANTAKLKKMNKVIRTKPIPEVAAIVDKAWGLLDAMRTADFAQGMDEKQDARWQVTLAQQNLREALTNLEDSEVILWKTN